MKLNGPPGFLVTILCLTGITAARTQDNCNLATVLPVQNGNCVTTVNGTTVGATASSQSAFIPSDADDDVWYKFTTPVSANPNDRFMVVLQLSDVTYSESSTGFYLELREGSANICIDYYSNNHYISAAQTNKQWSMTGLLPGTEYSIRLYTEGAGTNLRATYKICLSIPTPPANDNCSSPQALTVGETCVPSGPYSTLAATKSDQMSGDGSGRDDDVWFSFTTGSATQKYIATLSSPTYNTGFGNPVIELWTACNAVENAGFYAFTTTKDFGVLNPSTTYFIRIYTYGTSSRFSAFSICVQSVTPPPPPANNECAAAIPVEVGAAGFGPVVNGTTRHATQSAQSIGACSVNPDDDVWYSFVAPPNGNVQMKLENVLHPDYGSSQVMQYVLHSGACNAAGVVSCGTGNQAIFSGLTAGQTYRLRLMTQDAGSEANFSLSMQQIIIPGNDNCADAQLLTVNTDNTFNITTAGNTNNASTSGIAINAPCFPQGLEDVWYRFVAPASGVVQVRLSDVVNPGGGSTALFTLVYSGNCAALTQFYCMSTNSFDLLTGLTPGATYYLRTMSYIVGQSHTFRIGVMEFSPQDNISCANIRNLTTEWQRGSTLGQPVNNNIIACYGSAAPNRVLYYRFTATATTHYIDFKDWGRLSANQIGVGYRVYKSECSGNSVANTIKCVASVRNANDTIPNLTIGDSYTVLVMENTFNGGPAEFSIRVAPANTNVWVGTLSNEWNKAENWSAGMIPDANTEVIIPSGRRFMGQPRYPTITTSTSFRSVKIDRGARVDIAPGVVVTIVE
jgi:hypothetical protein